MENTSYINDLLLLLSAVGSATAGVICGWQLRKSNAPGAETTVLERKPAETNKFDESEPTDVTSRPVAIVAEMEAFPREKHGELALEQIDGTKNPLCRDAESFLEQHDPFEWLYGDQPQGLSKSEIRAVAERLVQMANCISADVDAHGAHLTEVNISLQSDRSSPTMESVMAAVERLVVANETMQAQLRESRDRIVQQSHQIESAETRANTDALTRVSNRSAFDRELANWTGEKPGVLAILDIDYFKKINDEHGHRAGDEVLRSVAATLRSQLEGNCMVARYGGEEFALVFSDNRLEDVLDLIESARRAIAEQETVFEGKSFRVSCSLGVTRMLADEPSTECLQRADDGMYLSKDAGRNCGHCIDSLTIGKRETPYRLGKKSNHSPLERLANLESLDDSYCELLQRLGKAPVKLSVIAVSISEPEATLAIADDDSPVTRFATLVEVCKAFCRAVDRLGYQDDHTLLICMPGIEGDAVTDRVAELQDTVIHQLQVNESALSIGFSSIAIGDTFERMVNRAIEQCHSLV